MFAIVDAYDRPSLRVSTPMPFVLDDLDVSDYVERWLAWVESSKARGRATLLRRKPVKYEMGSTFMMANIAPQAAAADSPEADLLLYAVLASFQNARFPGHDGPWPAARVHLEQAFEHARELGRSGVARNLLRNLADQSREADAFNDMMLAKAFDGDAGKLAAHDADMAVIRDRDVRAAALLDPSITLDQILLE